MKSGAVGDDKQKEELLRSLRKGDAQHVTIEQDGQSRKYHVAAVPQYKSLNIYDTCMQSVKREQLHKHDQKQKQSQPEAVIPQTKSPLSQQSPKVLVT